MLTMWVTQSGEGAPHWVQVYRRQACPNRSLHIAMRRWWLLLPVLLSAVLVATDKQKAYSTKYDNVDVDSILSNNRILTNYIKCMLDEGPCTPDGRELKKTLPDALLTGCEKCSEKQKSTSERVIRHLMKEREKDWERLLSKYDPKGEYKKRYESVIQDGAARS